MESISDELSFLTLMFRHHGSFGVGRSRRIAGAVDQTEVLGGARRLFAACPPFGALRAGAYRRRARSWEARGVVALFWRGGGSREACVLRRGRGRSASVSPLRLCPGAAQAASLDGWSGARSALSPQRLRRPSSPALTRIPREARSSAAAVLRSRCGPTGAGRPSRRLKTAIEAASGGFEEQSGETTMAQIGTFTRGDDGSFTGAIRTLNINVKATIKPVAKDNERSPDYRVAANGVELGAGWSKAAKDTGAEYVSVKLDDPSFQAPVYATLVQGEKGEHKLIWSR